jgi:uncharacterized membrane protein
MEGVANNAALTQTRREESLTLSSQAACVFLIMIVMSCVGWVAENAVKLISQGVMDNRYHVLPFIFPYGLAFLAMHIALGNTNDMHVFGKKLFKQKTKKSIILSNIIYFSVVCFFVFIGELAVGNFYEAVTGAVLWDYSSLSFCVTKYVCLASILGYGGGAYVLMKFIFYPFLDFLMNKANLKAVLIVDCTLGTIVVIDSVCMILITLITGVPPIYWTLKIF